MLPDESPAGDRGAAGDSPAPLSGDELPGAEMRGKELSCPVQGSGRLVEDGIEALENMRHKRGDVEADLDVGGGGLAREPDRVIEEDLVTSTLDDQGRQAGQVGEYG